MSDYLLTHPPRTHNDSTQQLLDGKLVDKKALWLKISRRKKFCSIISAKQVKSHSTCFINWCGKCHTSSMDFFWNIQRTSSFYNEFVSNGEQSCYFALLNSAESVPQCLTSRNRIYSPNGSKFIRANGAKLSFLYEIRPKKPTDLTEIWNWFDLTYTYEIFKELSNGFESFMRLSSKSWWFDWRWYSTKCLSANSRSMQGDLLDRLWHKH
jgi:hypothetical protein